MERGRKESLRMAAGSYCVTRRELLALVTFVHLYRPYLICRKFTLRTDDVEELQGAKKANLHGGWSSCRNWTLKSSPGEADHIRMRMHSQVSPADSVAGSSMSHLQQQRLQLPDYSCRQQTPATHSDKHSWMILRG